MEQKIAHFIDLVKQQVITEDGNILLSTPFSEFTSWDSLSIMTMIVMLEDEYHLRISFEKIEKMKNLQEIFDLIK